MNEISAGAIGKTSILFERYHCHVFNYLNKMNRDRMLSEDLAQNVFEKLIKYRRSYSDNQNFKAWLFTIVRNVNIDHHRKNKIHFVGDSYPEIASCENVQVQLETKEKNQRLMIALNQLPKEEKELIVMTKLQKMKYTEVAAVMGVSESTLKVRAHRSIKKLKDILSNDLKYEH